jgi:hypothetical protein
MRKLLSIFSLILLYVTVLHGQAAVNLAVTVSDNTGATNDIYFGLDLSATDGEDVGLGEAALPGVPPGGYFAAWLFPDFTTMSYFDYRAPGDPPPGAFPYTGHKSFTIRIQTDIPAGNPMTFSWNLPPEIAATSTIGAGSDIVSFSGTGSHTWSFNPVSLLYVFIEVDFVNIGPAGPEPHFAIAPPSLNFGPVGVTLSSTLQATVSNDGTDPLEISNVTSTDGQFTFSPNTFPISVPAGGNQVFDITFTPASLGSFSANIQFTHDGTNAPSPFNYPVQGVGADAGPTFGVDPTSLTFSTLVVGNSDTKYLTVTNNGLSNTLNITSVSVGDPVNYSVTPTTAVIAPGANQVFDVTFAPTVGGSLPTNVTFVHDAPTSPDVVPVTGAGYVPPAVSGLVFTQDTAFVLEEDFYSETMQLLGLPIGNDVHALQFRLLTNQVTGDDVILTFQSLVKGTDVSDPGWVLDYNVIRGDIQPNGASQDEILVLLYNINEGVSLPGGVDYTNLLKVNYRAADLPALVDYSKSSILITNAEASSYLGTSIPITPTDPELQVVVKNRVGSWGDVNGDGCLDILDLIMVVDHIVGRDSLDAAEFARADIAPWVPGNELPDADGFVNVQDLSVIQNTILSGFFPNGDPVGPCGPGLPKFNGDADATVNIYINSEGISAYLDSKIGIRGAQIEFQNVVDPAENLVINTPLGQGYSMRVDDLLRTLMYDRLAQKYIEEGVNQFMADMPFVISNYQDITLEKLILVDINQRKVMNIEVNLIYSTTPLPYDYVLWQNYPNPFNPSTSVKFQVPKTSAVTITVYDMLGQEVRTLFAGEVLRGNYTVTWDGMNNSGVKMSSGSYVYRMTAGEFVQSKKMVLVK